MGLMARAGSGAGADPVAAGAHVAVCVGYVDLGTQVEQKYMKPNETTAVRKIMLLWDLPYERMEYDGKDMPRMLSKKFTLSLDQKANLRKTLESWRGRAFTDAELVGFDLDNIVATACQLNVVHNVGKSGKSVGKTFAEVTTVMPLAKGMARPELERPPIRYQVFDDAAQSFVVPPETVPHWMQEIVGKSAEALTAGWKPGPKEVKGQGQPKPEAAQTPAPPAEDDDTPF